MSLREGGALLADLPKSISFKEDIYALLVKIEDRKPVLRTIATRLGHPLLASLLKERAQELIGTRIDWQLCGSGVTINAQRRTEAVTYCSLATASALEEWIVGESSQSKEELAGFLIRGFSRQMAGLKSLR